MQSLNWVDLMKFLDELTQFMNQSDNTPMTIDESIMSKPSLRIFGLINFAVLLLVLYSNIAFVIYVSLYCVAIYDRAMMIYSNSNKIIMKCVLIAEINAIIIESISYKGNK